MEEARMPEPGTAFRGVVSRMGERYGFLECPEVAALCSDGVFCVGSELQGLQVGDAVTFDMRLTEAGRPQGQNVMRIGSGTATATSTGWGWGSGSQSLESLVAAESGLLTGTIKTFSGKFAFIDCPPVKAAHNMDVFCPAVALVGLEVGDSVEFELSFNAKGQPQARNVSPKVSVDTSTQQLFAQEQGGSPLSAGTTFGVVNWIGDKFGFIDCPLVKAQFGFDTFVPRAALADFKLGDVVDFDLRFNAKGQPQAGNVRAHVVAGAEFSSKSRGETGEAGNGVGTTKYGTISSIGNKFGFIDCPPVKAQCGIDTFAPQAVLVGFNVGDVVDFDLSFNGKGQPQASNVRSHGGGGRKRKFDD